MDTVHKTNGTELTECGLDIYNEENDITNRWALVTCTDCIGANHMGNLEAITLDTVEIPYIAK